MPISIFRSTLFGLVAMMVCSAESTAGALRGTEWRPTRMGELEVPAASSAFIQFRTRGRLNGFSGCNRLFAEYEVTGDAIFIGPVAATRKACAESVMTREARLATALERARIFQRDGTRLVLFNEQHEPILEMRQTDWD